MKKTKPTDAHPHGIVSAVVEFMPTFEAHPDFFERIEKYADAYEKMRDTQKETFKNVLEAWRGFLAKEGFVLPENEDDFISWLFHEKYPDEPISIETCRKIATIKPELFKEFSQYKAELHGFKKSKPAPPPAEPLPAFEQVYKGSLSDLWGELSTTPKPLVSKSGNFIWTGENVSVLMALAQALLTADRIEGKRNAESVYRILCAHFGEEAAERQKAVFKNGTSTQAYLDHLATFDDLF